MFKRFIIISYITYVTYLHSDPPLIVTCHPISFSTDFLLFFEFFLRMSMQSSSNENQILMALKVIKQKFKFFVQCASQIY